jgi:hypothetical protein
MALSVKYRKPRVSIFDQSIGVAFALLLAVCSHLNKERFNSKARIPFASETMKFRPI